MGSVDRFPVADAGSQAGPHRRMGGFCLCGERLSAVVAAKRMPSQVLRLVPALEAGEFVAHGNGVVLTGDYGRSTSCSLPCSRRSSTFAARGCAQALARRSAPWTFFQRFQSKG
jgi:hypothetical protein